MGWKQEFLTTWREKEEEKEQILQKEEKVTKNMFCHLNLKVWHEEPKGGKPEAFLNLAC